MIKIKGYKSVEYEAFVGVLYDAFKRSGKKYVVFAYEMGVSSTQTSANTFSPKQKLSDEKLTKAMDILGVDGFVLTKSTVKYYYLKTT